MDRYELMWKITQKYGYIYDLRKIGNHKAKEVCEFGCSIHGWVTKIVDNLLHKKTVNGIGCPKCAAEVNKISWDKFLIKANKLYGNKFIFYKPNEHFDTKNYIYYECTDCGRKGHNRINVILNPKSKILCCDYIPNFSLTQEEFIKRIDKIFNKKYDTSKVKYINNHTEVILICPIHGEFNALPINLFKGHGCRFCGYDKIAKERTKSHEQYILDCEKVHGKGRYIYLSEYKGEKHDITFKCTKCGRITTIKAVSHLIRGSGCSFCIKSHLERTIQVFLETKNIKFTPQFKIANRQSLDFYLEEYNIAIECQGGQHFYENKFMNELNAIIKRDIRKYNYCKDNDINLIYYTEPKLLTSELINNEKFDNIYKTDNIFSNLDDLLNYIKNYGK